MGTFDDSTPKVRPLGEENPPPTPGRRTAIGAVLVLAIAGAIFLTTAPTQSPTEGVALPPLPTTSSTSTASLPPPVRDPDEPSVPITNLDLALSARMAELLDDANAVWEVLPEAEGEFVAIIGDPAAMDMVRVTRTSSLIQLSQPIVDWQSLAFDASGQHLAYVGDSPISDLPALHVESDTSVPVRDDVASFAWHSTIPGRIGWQELTSELLCWADLGGPHEPDAPTCVPGPEFGTRIVGFDDDGFLGIDDIGQTVSRYGFDGHVIGTISGENAWPRPNGDILIAERDRVNDLTIFTNVDRNLANPNQLTWAPQIRTDAQVLIAISPSVAYQEIAFVTASGEHQQLQVFNIYGELTHTIPLLGRIWDLAWDSTGRYLLAPGFVDSEHVLRIYDAVNPGIFGTSFSGWIQQALLVTRLLRGRLPHRGLTVETDASGPYDKKRTAG